MMSVRCRRADGRWPLGIRSPRKSRPDSPGALAGGESASFVRRMVQRNAGARECRRWCTHCRPSTVTAGALITRPARLVLLQSLASGAPRLTALPPFMRYSTTHSRQDDVALRAEVRVGTGHGSWSRFVCPLGAFLPSLRACPRSLEGAASDGIRDAAFAPEHDSEQKPNAQGEI